MEKALTQIEDMMMEAAQVLKAAGVRPDLSKKIEASYGELTRELKGLVVAERNAAVSHNNLSETRAADYYAGRAQIILSLAEGLGVPQAEMDTWIDEGRTRAEAEQKVLIEKGYIRQLPDGKVERVTT